MIDPFELLRAHVRNVADAAPSGTSIDELIAQITLEHHRGPASTEASGFTKPARARSRRWGAGAVGVALLVGIGAGAVVTASVRERRVVSKPEAGVLCHVSVVDRTSAANLPVSDDPVGACAALWASGALVEIAPGTTRDRRPALVACTGSLGLVEVFPGTDPDLCTRLGLAVAIVSPMTAAPLSVLNARISTDVNEQCLSVPEALKVVRSLLDELGFSGWSVTTRRVQGLPGGCSQDPTGKR